MKNQVLLINDMAGYGKVSLSAMFPVLSHMGFNLYNLPTALVSNTLDYGKFHMIETTDYMKKTLEVWDELGFKFDAICTGLILSSRQAHLVADYCVREASRGTIIFADPIMGDEGVLYCGIEEETIEHMKVICSVADYIVPNYTEAAFIAGVPYKDRISSEEGRVVIDRLRELGSKSVVITSVNVDGNNIMLGYDHKEDNYFNIPVDMIDVRFPGTGDIFSAIMYGHILQGRKLKDAAAMAGESLRNMIIRNIENKDKIKGILVETSLDLI